MAYQNTDSEFLRALASDLIVSDEQEEKWGEAPARLRELADRLDIAETRNIGEQCVCICVRCSMFPMPHSVEHVDCCGWQKKAGDAERALHAHLDECADCRCGVGTDLFVDFREKRSKAVVP